MALLFFKVWDCRRQQKAVIYLEDGENVILRLITKASKKFDINGSQLVLEKDGTPIDEDIVLHHFKEDTFMLLSPTEIWQEDGATISTATTLKNSSLNQSFEDQNNIAFAKDVIFVNQLSQATDIVSVTNEQYDIALQNNKIYKSVYTEDTNCTVKQSDNLNSTVSPSSETRKSIMETSRINCNSEYMWHEFEIPWESIPEYMITSCEEGKRDRGIITHIIHVIVNKMRAIKENLPTLAIKIATKKIIDKFPQTFRDVDEDGVVIGDGSYSIFKKIQDRNNYLNRPHKRQNGSLLGNPVSNKKRRISEAAGCSFFPTLSQPPENNDIQTTSINEMDHDFPEKMEKYFLTQKLFLNGNPNLKEDQNTWPILLSSKGALYFFSKITNSDLNILQNIEDAKFRKFCLLTDQNVDPENSKLLEIFLILCKYFKEEPDNFFRKIEDSLDGTEETFESEMMHPMIYHSAAENIFQVFYERCCVIKMNTFEEAFKYAFALFFNFNLKYPPLVSHTFELIQRYFLKIHPDQGTKSNVKLTGKRKNAKNRVLNLMNKLRNL